MNPEDLLYTSEHEWLRNPGEHAGSVRVGITDYAQEALGDIVYVSLPEVGEAIESGEHLRRAGVDQVGLATSTPRSPARSWRATRRWTPPPSW